MGGKGGRKPCLSLAGFDAAHAGCERMPQPFRWLTLGEISLAAARHRYLAWMAWRSSAIHPEAQELLALPAVAEVDRYRE